MIALGWNLPQPKGDILHLTFNIIGSVETRPPQLHSLLQFPPASIRDFLWASPPPPPPNYARFCDTRISSRDDKGMW